MPKKQRIVVIDDSPEIAPVIQKLLGNEAAMFAATSGEEGLALVRHHHPDVVLLDIDLGDVGGLAVLQALKQDEQTAHIPVVVISAHQSNLLREKMLRSKAEAFIGKPFDPEQLRAAVRSALAAPQTDPMLAVDRPRSVLVIDPSFRLAARLGPWLEKIGVDIISISSPEALCRLPFDQPIDLIILAEAAERVDVATGTYSRWRDVPGTGEARLLVLLEHPTPENLVALQALPLTEAVDRAIGNERLRTILRRLL